MDIIDGSHHLIQNVRQSISTRSVSLNSKYLTMVTNTTVPHLYDLLSQYFYVLPLITILSYIIYQRFFSPLSKIPGPFWASLSRWWLIPVSRAGHYNTILMSLHSKYGPIVRIAPDEVSVSDVSAIRQIYGAGSGFRKSDWYSVWQGTRKFDLFAGRDEKIHGQQRKLVARAYTMDALKDLEPYVDNMIEVFNRKMDEQVGKVVDLAKWAQLFAFGMCILPSHPPPSNAHLLI